MPGSEDKAKAQTEPQTKPQTKHRQGPPRMIEKGVTRRHSFFCVDRKRHTDDKTVIEIETKTIEVFGRQVEGWIVTTEEPVIDKTITLDESMEGLGVAHDTE